MLYDLLYFNVSLVGLFCVCVCVCVCIFAILDSIFKTYPTFLPWL